jgi:hypothetical protein
MQAQFYLHDCCFSEINSQQHDLQTKHGSGKTPTDLSCHVRV